jgi:hypothetical protein
MSKLRTGGGSPVPAVSPCFESLGAIEEATEYDGFEGTSSMPRGTRGA